MGRSSFSEFGTIAVVGMALTLATYFCFSAVQGEYGVLRRAEIQAEASQLQNQIDALGRNRPLRKQNPPAIG